MSKDDLIAHLVARYQEDQANDRQMIKEIDGGKRLFEHGGTSAGIVDVTDQTRARRVAHIEMLDGLIRKCASEQQSTNSGQARRSPITPRTPWPL